MLKKLIKYDIFWINRTMVIYFAITIILSALVRIAENFTGSAMGDLIYGILRGCTISAFVSVIINASIRIWERFRQNHYKDESYLTHTLPVTKSELYDSKALSALVSILLSLAVLIACFFLAFWNNDLSEYFRHLADSGDATFLLIGIFITAILEVIYIINVGFFSIVLGHRSNSGRVARSVIIGMVLYFALQTVLLIFIYGAGFFDDGIKAMFSNSPETALSFESYRTLIIIADSLYLVLNFVLYFAAKALFKKGVNVD